MHFFFKSCILDNRPPSKVSLTNSTRWNFVTYFDCSSESFPFLQPPLFVVCLLLDNSLAVIIKFSSQETLGGSANRQRFLIVKLPRLAPTASFNITRIFWCLPGVSAAFGRRGNITVLSKEKIKSRTETGYFESLRGKLHSGWSLQLFSFALLLSICSNGFV